MRRAIIRDVWPEGTPPILKAGEPLPELTEEEYTEPIKRGDDSEVLIQMALLIWDNHPEGKIKQGYTPLFCPVCDTLRGVGNDFEVIAGEHHPDGRLSGKGTLLPIRESIRLRCDEPDCDGVIVWPSENITWSGWDLPSQHARRLGLNERTFRDQRNRGLFIVERKEGTKEIRIRLDGLNYKSD